MFQVPCVYHVESELGEWCSTIWTFCWQSWPEQKQKKQKMLTPTVTIPKCIEIYSCNTFTLFHHDLNIEDVSLKQFPSNEFLVRKQRPFRWLFPVVTGKYVAIQLRVLRSAHSEHFLRGRSPENLFTCFFFDPKKTKLIQHQKKT